MKRFYVLLGVIAVAGALAVWYAAAEAGITSFMIDEAYGGGGVVDCLTACLVQEELCYGDAGIGNLLTSNGFFAAPVEALGTAEQRKRWLEPLTGTRPPMTAVAVTEPEVGSDAAGLRTMARRTRSGYVLSGRKAWISNAGVADYYVVFATVDPSKRARGVTAFVVERADAGVSFGPPVRKMGQRAIRSAEVILDDVEVDADRCLGEEGQGFYGLMRTFDHSRIVLGAAATGLARAALEYARDYACERRQFGKPIIDHQAVGFRLADVATRVDAARLLVLRAARAYDAGERVTREAAMAKLYASETAMFATILHEIVDCRIRVWGSTGDAGGCGRNRARRCSDRGVDENHWLHNKQPSLRATYPAEGAQSECLGRIF